VLFCHSTVSFDEGDVRIDNNNGRSGERNSPELYHYRHEIVAAKCVLDGWLRKHPHPASVVGGCYREIFIFFEINQ
jgi:hypothetical protein